MNHRLVRLMLIPAVLAVGLALSPALAAEATDRVWRITHALPAPWAATAPLVNDIAGATLVLSGGALQGPAPLRCASAMQQTLELPAEGLFEGQLAALPEAAGTMAPAAAARKLGLAALPAPALRITCSNAGFDMVQANDTTWLLALDQRIWVLSASHGTQAPAASAAGVVQRLLERHFDAAHGGAARGFTTQAMTDLKPYTTAAMQTAAAAWLALPTSPDEAPEIDGDPFTDSQEPVLHFAVGAAAQRGDQADVPVQMTDEARSWTLGYRLQRTAEGWRVDDVVLRDGTTLSKLFSEAKR